MARSGSDPYAGTREAVAGPVIAHAAGEVSTKWEELLSPVLSEWARATQVETDNSHISTLPVVRNFGHEWKFSFLWVNVSQADAFAADGKILSRASRQKRTKAIRKHSEGPRGTH